MLLTDRALGRATLARQLLLERDGGADPVEVVDRFVGLQAQNPLDPYSALWSRLAGFDPEVLSAAVEDRRLSRIVTLRGTIHLVTAADALRLRALVQPVLEDELRRHSQYKDVVAGLDLDAIVGWGRPLLAEPRTIPQLRTEVQARLPGVEPGAVTLVLRNRIPLVQVPPRGLWGRTKQVTLCDAAAWHGAPVEDTFAAEDLFLRYLAAFGPATVADAATWSRLTGLRAVFDGLRPRLRSFRDERGRELLDVEDGPRPDPDTPAPVRFLPEYDNVLLSHKDRTRFHRPGAAPLPYPTVAPRGTALVDGTVAAVWWLTDATLTVHHHPLSKHDRTTLEAEATAYAHFLPGAERVELLAVSR